MNYLDFLQSKQERTVHNPVEKKGEISDKLFPFQRDCVEFLLSIGRGAAFLDTGLGKTIIQCEWARHIEGRVLIIAPLAVANQTVQQARDLLGLDIAYSKDGTVSGQITITNYERVDKFDCDQFTGVVLDESSILKGFMGKTKQLLCERFENTPYKLACTATPAPNDYMELGNHSEFLGVMKGTEMLSRWFINDPSKVGSYKLKGHAVKPFWNWVSSWAACVSKPSDLGYPDDGYDLPPLKIKTVTVQTDIKPSSEEGFLFDMPVTNATNLHKSKRDTVADRVKLAADLVNGNDEPWLIWVESNEESKQMTSAIPDAIEVTGSDSADVKEARLMAFSDGTARVLVSKTKICGFGMNWQHCRNIIFASISYSYEKFYQAVRRSWRFGQKYPVNVTVMISDSEIPVWRIVEEKATNHGEMKTHMKYAVFKKGEGKQAVNYEGVSEITIPEWLATV